MSYKQAIKKRVDAATALRAQGRITEADESWDEALMLCLQWHRAKGYVF